MKVTLVGFKSVDFKDNNGDRVHGIKIFVAYPDNDTVGYAADGKFIQQQVFNSWGITPEQLTDAVDQVIDLEFGMKNKLVGITLPNPSADSPESPAEQGKAAQKKAG